MSLSYVGSKLYFYGGRIKKNKHKFVQKVAKKIILLISFVFNANISFSII